MEHLQVYSIPEAEKERIGRRGDGGFVIASLPNNDLYDLYIGIGIYDDYSFDKSIAVRYPDMPGFIFDDKTNPKRPLWTPQAFAYVHMNVSCYNTNVSTNLIPFISNYNNIFMRVKMCGSEWMWLYTLPDVELVRVKQLVIELHYLIDYREASPSIKTSVLQRLANMFHLVHVHGNNFTTSTTATEGIPYVLQCTYVRKDVYPYLPLNTTPFPTILDVPNCAGHPDIPLNTWPFCGMKST